MPRGSLHRLTSGSQDLGSICSSGLRLVAARSRRGMTMVEIMVALTVMTISVYIMSSTITTSALHMKVKEEQAQAVEGARNQLEVLRGATFGEVFALYNANPNDDPDGPGTAPGPHFAVAGLQALPDDADGFAGEILLPLSAAGLFENAEMADLGLPRDLNGDFLIDALDHSGDYLVLPVAVRVSWQGRAGARQFQMFTMLAKLERS